MLITSEIYYEGDQLILEVFDFSGNKIRRIDGLNDGREMLAKKSGRIIVVMLGPDTINQCTIFDPDGNRIWSDMYDDIITGYGQTMDEELWWIVQLSGRINNFNNDGKLIRENQYVKGCSVDVQYHSKTYKIYGDQK